jgi:hypothetical protein
VVTSTLSRLLYRLATEPKDVVDAVRERATLTLLNESNRWCRQPVTGDGQAVVSLTSFGHRISLVHYAIESIAAGSVRPRRMILWLDESDVLSHPPVELRRLMKRGLEVLYCENYGPHKKQYAYAVSGHAESLPLATADDDVIYPRDWLRGLLQANRQFPHVVNGYRAHRMTFTGSTLMPYSQWLPGEGTEASFGVMCTGVSGIIYPPEMVEALREEGDRFTKVAPLADDVWVHRVAVRHGFRSRQIIEHQAEFPAIRGSQRGTLYRHNVKEGGNDLQIAATYGADEIARILRDTRSAPEPQVR